MDPLAEAFDRQTRERIHAGRMPIADGGHRHDLAIEQLDAVVAACTLSL